MLFPEKNEQTRTDRELDSIAQLHTMLHTVPTYRRDSAWSRSYSASETRLGHVPPRCRCCSLKRMSKHAQIVSLIPSHSCTQCFTQFRHTGEIQRGQGRVLLQRLS